MKQTLSAQNAQSAQKSAQSAVANARIASSAIQQHVLAKLQRKLQLRSQNNFLAA